MGRGNPVVNVRMNDKERSALDHLVKIGDFEDRSEAMREFMYIFTEAVVAVHETQKTWKGVWQVMKGMQRLNERFDKVRDHANEYQTQDIFNQPYEEEFLTTLNGALTIRAMLID